MLKRGICLSVLLALCVAVNAQSCSGSLGDAVVNVDFGFGGGNAAALAAGITSYTFQSSGCPNDGSYRIINSIPGCHPNTWHQLTEDHTEGDTQGYMMLVNASNNPGVFYTQAVSGLCPNTTYEFAAWIVNIDKSDPILPNISFSIETSTGQPLSLPYSTGNIPNSSTISWLKYGFLFTTPVGITDIVLVMRNNAPGGQGNDLALDDITFRPCGPVLQPVASIPGNFQELCQGEKGMIALNANTTSGFINPTFQWQLFNGSSWDDIAGATTLNWQHQVSAASAGGYQFRLAAAESGNMNSLRCRVFSPVTVVSVQPGVTADAGTDKTTFTSQPITLDGTAAGGSFKVLWSPPDFLDDPQSLTPKASPTDDITYKLQVFSEKGCGNVASDEVFVKVVKQMKIPNTFSPNNDGVNDRWEILGLSSYPGAEIKVYNRFGALVFKGSRTSSWDGDLEGKNVPSGSYSYIINLGNGQRLSGWLLLVR